MGARKLSISMMPEVFIERVEPVPFVRVFPVPDFPNSALDSGTEFPLQQLIQDCS